MPAKKREKTEYVPTTDFSHATKELKWDVYPETWKTSKDLVLVLNCLNERSVHDPAEAKLKLLMLGLDEKRFLGQTGRMLYLHAKKENPDKDAGLEKIAGFLGPDNISEEGSARMVKYAKEAINDGMLSGMDAFRALHNTFGEHGKSVAQMMPAKHYFQIKRAMVCADCGVMPKCVSEKGRIGPAENGLCVEASKS